MHLPLLVYLWCVTLLGAAWHDLIPSSSSFLSSVHPYVTAMAALLGAPLKVLTRPLASDQDPAAGFSFAKAKPPLPNTVNVAAHQGPSPEHHTTSVVKDPFNVPFPKVTFATTDLASGHSPAKTVKNIDQPQANMQNRSLKASRDPLTSVARAPKITKSRGKKTRLGAVTDDPPQPLNPKYAYTEDDLLKLLMYRRRQGQQELEDFRATQQHKETEIQRLLDISNDLYSQLQDFEKRETQTNAELTKIKANKPIWETKIKQLSDYVKGLTNDHNRLRDDADDLRKRHGDVFVAERERSNRLEDQISGLKDSMNSFVEGYVTFPLLDYNGTNPKTGLLVRSKLARKLLTRWGQDRDSLR